MNKVKKVHNDVRFNFQVEIWKSEVAKRLPMLEKLDGELIIRTEENETLLQLDSPVQIWRLEWIVCNLFFWYYIYIFYCNLFDKLFIYLFLVCLFFLLFLFLLWF